MKITEIKTFLMQAGAPAETAWAAGERAGGQAGGMSHGRSRNWLFVKVLTDEGVYGVGEGSGWPRVAETAIRDLTNVLIGEDPFDIERLWQKMHLAFMGHGIVGTVGSGAIAAIDMALWDIKGKALGTPVWNLLGGKVRDSVRIYSHASTAETALSLKKRGITAVKTGNVAGTVEKVDAVRRAVGDEVDIMVDLHGPPWMTVKDAIIVGKALEPYDLLFFEDPVAPENLDALEQVRRAVEIPIAAGERYGDIWALRPLIERHLVDVIQPDTGRAGISQIRKVAAMAEAHYIVVAPHSGTLGPVAEFAALHLLASISNGLILERLEDDWPGRDDIVTPVLRAENGFMKVPDAPGLGVDIVEEEIAKYPSEQNCGVPGNADGDAYAKGTFNENTYFQARLRRAQALGTKRRVPMTEGCGEGRKSDGSR